jgi:hypothetical protein
MVTEDDGPSPELIRNGAHQIEKAYVEEHGEEEILELLEAFSLNPSWSIHLALQKGSLSILE